MVLLFPTYIFIYPDIATSLYLFNFLLLDFVYNLIYPQLHIKNKMKMQPPTISLS